MPEPSEWLASVGDVLDRLGLRWAAIGALAANRYRGEARFTADADALVEWDDRLIGALEDAGYQVQVVREGDEAPHLLRLRRGAERIDLLPPVIAYQDVALRRAGDNVVTVEDVIVFKLIAWRRRDRDDVRSILEAGASVDEAYVERWAREWEVLDRWHEARGG